MRAIRAGDLRHRVTIQSATDTTAAGGTVSRTWASVATVWASITPIKAQEQVEADQTVAVVTHLIATRSNELQAQRRVVVGSRTFHVTGVRNIEERGRLYIADCQEVTD